MRCWLPRAVVALLACGCGESHGPPSQTPPPTPPHPPPVTLHDSPLAVVASRSQSLVDLLGGWQMQSSAGVAQAGHEISKAGFATQGWYSIDIPATVIAGLLQNGVYSDPYVQRNLETVIAAESIFTVSWWYRRDFELPAGAAHQRLWLNLQGVNYRANVWLNGNQIADDRTVAGAFRQYELDITDQVVTSGGTNTLAIEVSRPNDPLGAGGDLAITYGDWHPRPADWNMGITNDVFIAASGPVAVRSPLVSTQLSAPAPGTARLTVTAELKNGSPDAVVGQLTGTIDHDIAFTQEVQLDGGELKTARFSADDWQELVIENPRLWWPRQYGEPYLHTLRLELRVGGELSDSLETSFGIRQISSHLDDAGHVLFEVNGRPILIRGAAWAPDMFQRRSAHRQEGELRHFLNMNLNAIRLEGKFEDDRFFDFADREGILILVGWCCCDSWQDPKDWSPEQNVIANESLKSQMRRLRNRPSSMVWMNGSDAPPDVPDVERAFLAIERDLSWPNPIASHAAGFSSQVTGQSGFKMLGPYEWVPPLYWEADTEHGGAFGFASEVSPGPAVPPLETLEAMLGADHLWPMDDVWSFHAGLYLYTNVDVFTDALTRRYGVPVSAADYARKAQAMAYESHRAMFEAYGRNKYRSATGVIQWMLNNGWPSLIWHLFDYYLRAGGSYFGAKKALEPLHVQYSYVDDNVVVVNSSPRAFSGLRVTADIFDVMGARLGGTTATIDVAADAVVTAFTLPGMSTQAGVQLVRLALTDAAQLSLSINSYWLSNARDELAWDRALAWYTPQSAFADYSLLQDLPRADLVVTDRHGVEGSDEHHVVTVNNRGPGVAFQVHLSIRKGEGGEEVLPVFWEDGYFTLLPGETREVAATYRVADLGDAQPVVEAQAWNY